MNHISLSRRSRPFRPAFADVIYLEDRKLLTIDYDIEVIPDASMNFDPNNYTLVNFTTFQSHATEIAMGDAFAAPGEIEGGEDFDRDRLVASIGDKRDALISMVNATIARRQAAIDALRDQVSVLDDLIAEDNAVIEDFGVNPWNYDPSEVLEIEKQRNTRAGAAEFLEEKINEIEIDIQKLNILKYLINKTHDLMITSIVETNWSMEPGDPPWYVYSVSTTAILTS